jgi:protein O-GlcNAc transferase
MPSNVQQLFEEHFQRGKQLRQQGRLADAETEFCNSVELVPESARALNALGLVIKEQSREGEAIALFRRAIHCRQDYHSAWLNLGNTLSEIDQHDEAERCLRGAITIKPDYAIGWHDLGAWLEQRKRLTEAVDAYQRAVTLQPEQPQFRASLENARRHLCDWRSWPESLNELLQITRDCLDRHERSPLWPAASLRFPTIMEDRLRIARDFAGRFKHLSDPPMFEVAGRNDAKRSTQRPDRLRIGFLSHEFGQFIVSETMQGIYSRFDRTRFEIFGFATSDDDGSDLRQRISSDCDHFLDIAHLNSADAARCVAQQGIHILLDLNSYMPGGRPEIAAHRPAPVQVSYRFPGTTGADWIDYILTDEITTPPEHDKYYHEKPFRLPVPYLVTTDDVHIPQISPAREEFGLPPDGFVFCSFNQTHKLTPEIFGVWMRILKAVPDSVLWQIESNIDIRNNLCRAASDCGIATNRIVFADKAPLTQHLARYRHADLFLDTPTHGAIVTAFDVLRMGVPLLTFLGDTFTSRAPASLVTAAGIPELAVSGIVEYEQMAVTLATSPNRLAEFRNRLAAGNSTSPLTDTDLFVSHLQNAFDTMWETHRRYPGSDGRSGSLPAER